MNEEKVNNLICGLLSLLLWVAAISFCVGLGIGSMYESNKIKKDAIKHNAARWVVDENGKVDFEWKKGDRENNAQSNK
jgi:hypothetical protein